MNHIAIVGATGLVGTCFLTLMREQNIHIQKLSLFASERNKDKTILFRSKPYQVQTLKEDSFQSVDIAFFSAGGVISKKWAKKAIEQGTVVIDNSSAFRMNSAYPLVVPEVNASVIQHSDKLIANPNCSTIQMCLALHPLHSDFGLEEVQVATYQSMSGAGAKKIEQLETETAQVLQNKKGSTSPELAFNCIPQIGEIQDNGFSTEDTKMQQETKKILNTPDLSITAFTVRVPTIISHGEVVWVKLKTPPKNRQELIESLKNQKGLIVSEKIQDYPDNLQTSHQNAVYVGRIHQVPNDPCRWMMWICADNIRKGAALNGLQIAKWVQNQFLQ